ncbi:MAG: hypothetical protein GF341_11440 [candidate division Zixibacteria bacterium]|nr:hypothetical protein [candidate division Zixibacteria bacterium]
MMEQRVVKPLTKDERDALLEEFNAIQDAIQEGVKKKPRMSDDERDALRDKRDKLRQEYFDRLPRILVSRCPVCKTELMRAFDPWGLDGLWWQEEEFTEFEEPPACEHFAVLTGALNLNGLPPLGGRSQANPGPEVPYVIPAVLDLPTMTAVIAQIPMENGYTAFPIAYFCERQPPPEALTQPWRETSYNYTDVEGNPAWTVKTDPWEFELGPWIQKGKVKWIAPNDDQFQIRSGAPNDYPYADVEGLREQLQITDEEMITIPPPAGEDVDPFNE